jgi:hypothetical protein
MSTSVNCSFFTGAPSDGMIVHGEIPHGKSTRTVRIYVKGDIVRRIAAALDHTQHAGHANNPTADIPCSSCRPDIKNRVIKACGKCGSHDVRKDANAQWDYNIQDWVLVNVYDQPDWCNDCDAETELVDDPLIIKV